MNLSTQNKTLKNLYNKVDFSIYSERIMDRKKLLTITPQQVLTKKRKADVLKYQLNPTVTKQRPTFLVTSKTQIKCDKKI